MTEFTRNSNEKCHSTRFTYNTVLNFPRYYLVCFAAVFLKLRSHSSLPRCYKFSPAVDARWELAAKTRFCRNLMGPYFQAVLYFRLNGFLIIWWGMWKKAPSDSWSHVRFSFSVQGSEKQFTRRILQSIRCHLGSFSMHPLHFGLFSRSSVNEVWLDCIILH